MYYLDEENTFLTLPDLASAASNYLAEYYSENGEEAEFPETFSPWEEKGEYFRLFYIPTGREAECGSDKGAWHKTIEAYADADNWRAEAWENL